MFKRIVGYSLIVPLLLLVGVAAQWSFQTKPDKPVEQLRMPKSYVMPDPDKNVYRHLLDSTVMVKCMMEDESRGYQWGTGWIIHAKDGTTFVWTAGHVVSLGDNSVLPKIQVIQKLEQDEIMVGDVIQEAEVVAFSPWDEEDLCVLKLHKKNYARPSKVLLDESKYPEVGSHLIHCGAGSGTLEFGCYISEGTLGRKGTVMKHKVFDFYNGAARHGCSGGPVTNINGEVVGMLTQGVGDVYSWFIPMERIKHWAVKEKVLYTLDSSLDVPSN